MNKTEKITRGEFDNAVVFDRAEIGNDTVMLSASIAFKAWIDVSKYQLQKSQKTEILAREHLVEMLLRRLYDFDRQELCEAISKLHTCSPFDYQGQQEAIEKILIAAKRQPPL